MDAPRLSANVRRRSCGSRLCDTLMLSTDSARHAKEEWYESSR